MRRNPFFLLQRRIHFKSAKEWKQFMFPKINRTRIKKIRYVSENDMIHKPQILKYPYFKMKKLGRYNKVEIDNNTLFNRDIEIIYDHRYCSVFQKLKRLVSLNLQGIIIKEQCTDDFSFEIYDCLQNKILLKKNKEELDAELLYKELLEKISQSY